MTDEELAKELWFLIPLVGTLRKLFENCFCKSTDKGDKEDEGLELKERVTEVEMSSLRSGNIVKHNFSSSIGVIYEGRDSDSEFDEDPDIENAFTANPIHSSISDFDMILLDLAKFGKGDNNLDENVWNAISTTDDINRKSMWGDTIILRVCQHKCRHLLPMVLRRGADVDALTREGTSCLHFVCRPKHASSAMARDLLEAGSNPNVGLTKTGITALHYEL